MAEELLKYNGIEKRAWLCQVKLACVMVLDWRNSTLVHMCWQLDSWMATINQWGYPEKGDSEQEAKRPQWEKEPRPSKSSLSGKNKPVPKKHNIIINTQQHTGRGKGSGEIQELGVEAIGGTGMLTTWSGGSDYLGTIQEESSRPRGGGGAATTPRVCLGKGTPNNNKPQHPSDK